MIHNLLDSPCIFCGYSAVGYYQPDTHSANCPWRSVGGLKEREEQVRGVVRKLRAELEAARKVADAAVAVEIVFNARCKLTEFNYSVDDDASQVLLSAQNAAELAVEAAVREYRARAESGEGEWGMSERLEIRNTEGDTTMSLGRFVDGAGGRAACVWIEKTVYPHNYIDFHLALDQAIQLRNCLNESIAWIESAESPPLEARIAKACERLDELEANER